MVKEDEMFAIVHQMRTRMITSLSFTGDRMQTMPIASFPPCGLVSAGTWRNPLNEERGMNDQRKSHFADLYVRFIPFETEYQTSGQLL